MNEQDVSQSIWRKPHLCLEFYCPYNIITIIIITRWYVYVGSLDPNPNPT